MPLCLFTSDLHGRTDRFEKLCERIAVERPTAVFLGGDLLPSGTLLFARSQRQAVPDDFVRDFLARRLQRLREQLGSGYPRVFAILGNDDPRHEEPAMREAAAAGLWDYVHGARADFAGRRVYGYACVPPTPFRLKDWERYDVSRYVDPGCLSPEEGRRTVEADEHEVRYGTIQEDLARLAGDDDLAGAILLFHSPPYQTSLDRAALDGKLDDGVPLDVHVGSIAIRRFVEDRQPLVTLHGHVHESTRLTGAWRERLGRTWMFQGAHDGQELAVVRFDPDRPDEAERLLV